MLGYTFPPRDDVIDFVSNPLAALALYLTSVLVTVRHLPSDLTPQGVVGLLGHVWLSVPEYVHRLGSVCKYRNEIVVLRCLIVLRFEEFKEGQ